MGAGASSSAHAQDNWGAFCDCTERSDLVTPRVVGVSGLCTCAACIARLLSANNTRAIACLAAKSCGFQHGRGRDDARVLISANTESCGRVCSHEAPAVQPATRWTLGCF